MGGVGVGAGVGLGWMGGVVGSRAGSYCEAAVLAAIRGVQVRGCERAAFARALGFTGESHRIVEFELFQDVPVGEDEGRSDPEVYDASQHFLQTHCGAGRLSAAQAPRTGTSQSHRHLSVAQASLGLCTSLALGQQSLGDRRHARRWRMREARGGQSCGCIEFGRSARAPGLLRAIWTPQTMTWAGGWPLIHSWPAAEKMGHRE